MTEPIIATDQDGTEVEVHIIEGGDILLRWPGGSHIRLTSEQSLEFAKAALEAYHAGTELNIHIGQWTH